MRRELFVAVLGSVLAACNASQQPPDASVPEGPIFGRTDCQIMSGNPTLTRQFEVAKEVCVNRAEAASISGTTAIPVGYGVGDAIASGIQRGTAQGQIFAATIKSCMAEQGYILRMRQEHIEACSAISQTQSGKK